MRYAWIEHIATAGGEPDVPVTGGVAHGLSAMAERPPSARAQANARLDAQVASMHAASEGSYGRPRIVRGLREQGMRVGPERVPQPATPSAATGVQAPLSGHNGFQPP